MAIKDDLVYEINERGERVIVKSEMSTQRAYLRFSNKTKRPVDIWWRDFRGKGRHYMRLEPGGSYDVNSFISHPWEFSDAATKESYLVNNSVIFRAPPNVGGMLYRTNWNITIGLRSLRETALLAVATRIPEPNLVTNLDLPRSLQTELRDLVEKLTNINPSRAE